jgi:hypothetical protein
MPFNEIVAQAKTIFPNLQISFKDTNWFMKLLGTLLFFNPGFMSKYITTIGDTIFFPSQSYIDARPTSASIIILHELTHINDSTKINDIIFNFLYLIPQILSLPILLLLFCLTWKIVVPLAILFACPLPSYFRMVFEKRAYMVSLYANNAICKKYNLIPDLAAEKTSIMSNFITSAYYFMWPFSASLSSEFDAAITAIQNGKRPFNDPWFDQIDKLLLVA